MTTLDDKPVRRRSRPEVFNRNVDKPPTWTYEQIELIRSNIQKSANGDQDVTMLYSMILGDE